MDKTLYILSEQKISLDNNNIVLKNNEETKVINLNNIDNIILENNKTSLSLMLLNKLVENNICVIVCDGHKLPYSILSPLKGTSFFPRNITRQFNWKHDKKANLWKVIVEEKIKTQKKILDFFGIDTKYDYNVLPDDQNNVEGQFARIYFERLFGRGFHRHSKDDINSALNYGYAVLLSKVCQAIYSYGYLTQIGIHHHSESNNLNLAYDLIEPFRPCVDLIVRLNKNEELNAGYKQKLISILNDKIKYNNIEYSISYAIKLYVRDFFHSMNNDINLGSLEIC